MDSCVQRLGWGSHPQCCAHSAADCAHWEGLRVILVGEAINFKDREVGSLVKSRWVSAGLGARCGAFRLGFGRSRLIRCGLRWSSSADLLHPGPCGWWDEALAKKAVLAWFPLWEAQFDLIVLVGKKVLQVSKDHLSAKMLALPHPSGRNQTWVDEQVRYQIQQGLAATRERLRGV